MARCDCNACVARWDRFSTIIEPFPNPAGNVHYWQDQNNFNNKTWPGVGPMGSWMLESEHLRGDGFSYTDSANNWVVEHPHDDVFTQGRDADPPNEFVWDYGASLSFTLSATDVTACTGLMVAGAEWLTNFGNSVPVIIFNWAEQWVSVFSINSDLVNDWGKLESKHERIPINLGLSVPPTIRYSESWQPDPDGMPGLAWALFVNDVETMRGFLRVGGNIPFWHLLRYTNLAQRTVQFINQPVFVDQSIVSGPGNAKLDDVVWHMANVPKKIEYEGEIYEDVLCCSETPTKVWENPVIQEPPAQNRGYLEIRNATTTGLNAQWTLNSFQNALGGRATGQHGATVTEIEITEGGLGTCDVSITALQGLLWEGERDTPLKGFRTTMWFRLRVHSSNQLFFWQAFYDASAIAVLAPPATFQPVDRDPSDYTGLGYQVEAQYKFLGETWEIIFSPTP